MIDAGCQPNAITINNLMRVHVKAGQTDRVLQRLIVGMGRNCEEAIKVINAIVRKGMREIKCKPNTVTCNILMRMSADSKSADMVIKLKQEMEEGKIEPNVNT
ncbi:hypothetical protein AgCh_035974 [Apium graveolens]